MKKVLRWVGRILGGLATLIVIAVMVVMIASEVKLRKTYSIAEERLLIPNDAESIENGERLTFLHGCVECHGENMSGKLMLNDPALATIHGANLSPGEGGAGQIFSDADWVRAIRHGVGEDGLPLIIMPSSEYNNLGSEDLKDIVAYLKTLEPVDYEDTITVGPMGRFMLVTEIMPFTLLHAAKIDHSKPIPEDMPVTASAEYGEYLAITCQGCHRADLSGGSMAGPDPAHAANLTPAGDVAGWTEETFIRAMREGIRPDGSQISDLMPWKVFGSSYSDTELRALWLYLQSLPPVESEAQ
jgi:mono/diheme cytochrome c family protein